MTTEKEIRLLIADDHAVVRVGLVSMLTLEPDLKVVAEAETGEQAIALFLKHRPTVALIDVRMPGMDGIAALERIVAECLEACVLMLSTSELSDDVARAMEAGASGYLLKTMGQQELVKAIRGAACGEIQLSAALRERLARCPLLSPREQEVLTAMGGGLANKEIAERLTLSEHTIKTHVKNILGKLCTHDRAGAVAAGFKHGILKV